MWYLSENLRREAKSIQYQCLVRTSQPKLLLLTHRWHLCTTKYIRIQ